MLKVPNVKKLFLYSEEFLNLRRDLLLLESGMDEKKKYLFYSTDFDVVSIISIKLIIIIDYL